MSRPPAQTTLYSLDRTQSLTASHADGDRDSVEKTDKPDTDAEAQGDYKAPEIEQDDGVTRIEALCTSLAHIRSGSDPQISSLVKVLGSTLYGHLLV